MSDDDDDDDANDEEISDDDDDDDDANDEEISDDNDESGSTDYEADSDDDSSGSESSDDSNAEVEAENDNNDNNDDNNVHPAVAQEEPPNENKEEPPNENKEEAKNDQQMDVDATVDEYQLGYGGNKVECGGEWLQCGACFRYVCCTCWYTKHKEEIQKMDPNLVINDEWMVQNYGKLNKLFNCSHCIGLVKEPLNIWLDYTKLFYEKTYGPKGRTSMAIIEKTDDFAWLIMSGDSLIFKYRQMDYNGKKFLKLRDKNDFMEKGMTFIATFQIFSLKLNFW